MRFVLSIMAVLVGGGIGLGLSCHSATAGSLPAVSDSVLAPSLIEKAGWRRYRRQGYGPVVVLPNAEVDVGVDVDGDVGVDVDVPAVIVLPPPRPLSCGEYRYWDGARCVDARYNKPYLGPR
ncbi:MAG: hypothetical protein ACRECM_08610 [Methyloceanibacter sp.]